MKPIVIAGGSGFLGQLLATYFLPHAPQIIVLTRKPYSTPAPASPGIVPIPWDGITLGPWAAHLDGAGVLINLAGRSVNCRYHLRNRQEILHSRIDSTRILGEAVSRCKRPPTVWLNSSTATLYKHSIDRPMDEIGGVIGSTPEAKDHFSVDVAEKWEEAFHAVPAPSTRKVLLRSAMVLGHGDNSVFPTLRRMVRCGLGGRMGSGNQYVSWIHGRDYCRAVAFLMNTPSMDGAVNLAAPNPLPNREMMAIMREECGVSFGLPAYEWMLEIGAFFMRTETELIIKSRRVVPTRLLAAGFEFHYPQFRDATRELLGSA